jgi:sporulation protein YlmC with PRC-barrel domain
MGTQVITRDTGRRLGVVGEVVVDIDRREVVALGLRDNPLTRFLPGLPRWMPLESIRQVGDVILVDSADSLSEGFNPERYSKVINCQVVTESGAQLGRVLGFSFDIETGELTTLVIGALGVPLLGEGVLSTWELAVGEIVSSGTDRIIVYEGAEEKLKQLGTGLLEKLGIGGSSWEQEERERFRSGAVPAENQLPAGLATPTEQRRIQPATSQAVVNDNELDYLELEDRRERQPLRQRRYLDDDLESPEPGRRQPECDDERSDFGQRDFGQRDFSPRDANQRDFEPPERGRFEPVRREPEPFERGRGDRDRDDFKRPEPARRGPERTEPERPERNRMDPDGRDSEPMPRLRRRDDREPEVSGSRDWEERRDEAPRGERIRERLPLNPERSSSANPRAERPVDEQAYQPSRRPLAAEPRPVRGGLDDDPIDVEPEVLDDPW